MPPDLQLRIEEAEQLTCHQWFTSSVRRWDLHEIIQRTSSLFIWEEGIPAAHCFIFNRSEMCKQCMLPQTTNNDSFETLQGMGRLDRLVINLTRCFVFNRHSARVDLVSTYICYWPLRSYSSGKPQPVPVYTLPRPDILPHTESFMFQQIKQRLKDQQSKGGSTGCSLLLYLCGLSSSFTTNLLHICFK